MKTIHLSLPATPAQKIPIVIGSGALRELPNTLSTMDHDRIMILHDEGVASIAADIKGLLPDAELLSVPRGEESKSLTMVERVTQELLERGVSRKSVLILVGGGMLTDLGGFIGSTYMRGICFINVPTSLLCMVDAGIGGKTGVDIGTTKNILGTFAHPEATVMDTDVLKTLPDEQLKEGLVEVIKMAAMLDADYFAWLEVSLEDILKREEAKLTECIERAVTMKAAVVEADEREGGRRMFLNFGHTIGHALEAHSSFALSHGEAVSRGMVAEMAIVESEGRERITALLKQLQMPVDPPTASDADALWSLMEYDKKTHDGTVVIAVPKKIGEGQMQAISPKDFRRICT